MAKKKTAKKKNPADLTLRNLGAEGKRIQDIRSDLRDLGRRVRTLEKAFKKAVK